MHSPEPDLHQPAAALLRPFLEDLVEQGRAAAQRQGLLLMLCCDPYLAETVQIDLSWLRGLLQGILRSAIQHTPAGSLTLYARTTDERLQLAIEDTDTPRAPQAVFAPASAGLYLVAEENVPTPGSLFTVSIPLSGPAPAPRVTPAITPLPHQDPAMQTLMRLYRRDLLRILSTLQRAVRDSDKPTIAHLLYRIHGSAGSYGFGTLSKAAGRCADQLAQGMPDGDDLDHLQELLQQAAASI